MMADHRIYSQPVRLHMYGWESDTLRLQRFGWQLAACQDVQYGRLQIAMKHEQLGLKAVTRIEEFPYYFTDPYMMAINAPFPVLQVASVGRSIPIYLPHTSAFTPIDAQPTLRVDVGVRELEDFVHFMPLRSARQLILPEAKVPDLLERILELQQPMAEENFKKMAERGEPLPQRKVHAEIVSLAA